MVMVLSKKQLCDTSGSAEGQLTWGDHFLHVVSNEPNKNQSGGSL